LSGIAVKSHPRKPRRPEKDRPRVTVPPPQPVGLVPALERNIQALREWRDREEAAATFQDRLAQAITTFTGSMAFVYVHVALFGFWIAANLGWIPGVPRWDPSFVVLAMAASVEAIFLSTFVLINQNRMARTAERQAELDLQISLLAEHEVTKLMTMVAAVAKSLGIETDAEISELQRDVAPEAVLEELEESEPK
jgi:uncharacterized membrane protein